MTFCNPVGNNTISKLPQFGYKMNEFFEITKERGGVYTAAAEFVDNTMNEWKVMFGVAFEQKEKIEIMLWEYRWGRFYTRSRNQIILIAIFYVIMSLLSCYTFVGWWLVYKKY